MVPRKYYGMNIGIKIKMINVFWAEHFPIAHLKLQDREFYESSTSKQKRLSQPEIAVQFSKICVVFVLAY
jgi:hypothetical protein